MERKVFHQISCPLHPSEIIQRVSLAEETERQLYCIQCIGESPDPKSLFSTLQTFENFLNIASQYYSKRRSEISSVPEMPSEYSDLLSVQNEQIDKLSQRIEEEKGKVETIFQEISEAVMHIINQKKEEYISLLDAQVSRLRQHYSSFESQLRKKHPKPEDMDVMFPSKEEIEDRFSEVEDFSHLCTFVENIKEDLREENEGEAIKEYRLKVLDLLAHYLKEVEPEKFELGMQSLDLSGLNNIMEQDMNRIIQTTINLKNSIAEYPLKQPPFYPESSIISIEDFKLIQEWLDPKYEFAPKLLYRSSRDGPKFHEKCDGKGPTVTVLRCQFEGSEGKSVIGGFLDQNWHNKNGYISSSEAFIFSLTSKIKCPIQEKDCAAYGGSGWGINFGCGCINVQEKLEKCFCWDLKNYTESRKILDSKNYVGGKIAFSLEDMEVYTVK